MPRYRLIIEYQGSAYVGWQFQDNGRSVQGAIEAALKAFTHEEVRVHVQAVPMQACTQPDKLPTSISRANGTR